MPARLHLGSRKPKHFEFLELEGAWHGYDGDQQIEFLTAVEQFLAKHNPAK